MDPQLRKELRKAQLDRQTIVQKRDHLEHEIKEIRRNFAYQESKWTEEKVQLEQRIQMLADQCEELQKINSVEQINKKMADQEEALKKQIMVLNKEVDREKKLKYKLEFTLGKKKDKYKNRKAMYEEQQQKHDHL